MMNSKTTTRRVVFPLLALGLIVPACVGDPDLGDDELIVSDSDENVAETSEALTTVTTTRGPLANSNCNADSKVSINLASNLADANNLAPWKTLAANGTFSLGSGANGVQFRYWIDDQDYTSQTDGMVTNVASGTWSWTFNNVNCGAQKSFTVCAIPYVNGNACGDLTGTSTQEYRTCKKIYFRACSNGVGIIPEDGVNCPEGADTLLRHMDDEDHNNNNDYSGWIGKTGSDSNTDLSFCRVDGRKFKPLMGCNGTTVDPTRDYAVLKLGSVCPNGSVEFSKYINNENTYNKNSHSDSFGGHYPNEYTENTKLFFCFFGKASSVSATMGSFPSLGIPYGVFGRLSLVNVGAASTTGWYRSDDEDSILSSNSYNAPSTIQYRASQIITNGNDNTTFYTAKVNTSTNSSTGFECEICGNGICRGSETPLSCQADCGTCGNEICDNGETESSCAQDCTGCGDGICDTDEIDTCPQDCR